MTEIICVNATEEKHYQFDDLNHGDMFMIEGGYNHYIALPYSINYREIDDWNTTITEVEEQYQFNAYDLDSREPVWFDDDTKVIPFKRVHLNYQLTT